MAGAALLGASGPAFASSPEEPQPSAREAADPTGEIPVDQPQAPAPQAIPVDELPLNEKDKRLVEKARSANLSAAAGDVKADSAAALAAATTWCGNWLADPGNAVNVSAVPGTEMRWPRAGSDNPTNNLFWWWKVNQGTASGATFGWSKAYHSDGFQFAGGRITTGWWDNAGDPHFCGWGSSQYRSLDTWSDWVLGSYTAGIRKSEATYIRAHFYHDGWDYGTRKSW
ncbi:hypothetical protein [Planomonospora sphaerica]|uniref:hypothetical protein n=1 Tax=Planomonospora sphaerica TaxID=161355 RepID=UPI00083B58E0|nr:hypothetical protein [Planomonospora sphaerica]